MALVVSGLNGNGYYINNDIYVDLSINDVNSQVLYYTIRLTNSSTAETSGDIKVYPKLDGTLKLNITPLVKSMFKVPTHNTNYSNVITDNSNRELLNIRVYVAFEVASVQSSYTQDFNSKSFFRGGEIGNKNNLTTSVGEVLRVVETLPYWSGYPTAEYKVTSGYNVEKNPLMDNVVDKELRITKGCNHVYLKFLNSKGGYSYWLFEGLTENKGSSNAGYSNNFGVVLDYGNSVSPSIQTYSIVPKRFYPLMLDLIESSEIYLYEDNNWERIINDNNKLDRKEYKKNYEVKLSFERVSNYNPQVLWQ